MSEKPKVPTTDELITAQPMTSPSQLEALAPITLVHPIFDGPNRNNEKVSMERFVELLKEEVQHSWDEVILDDLRRAGVLDREKP